MFDKNKQEDGYFVITSLLDEYKTVLLLDKGPRNMCDS